MRGRWTVNLLLLVLVIALGHAMHRELEAGGGGAPLTGLDPAGISAIAIERTGAPAIRLSATAEGWRMEEPYRVPADGERIAKLVRIAATPVRRSFPSAGGRELGLEPERLRLTLDGLVLSFGSTDPVGHDRYVAVGEQVHLIADGFQHHLLAAAEDYVGRRLLPPGPPPLSGILDGEPLPPEALAELADLAAERVEPLGKEISGRLLSLEPAGGGPAVRLLVSPDGRRWSRLDLRLDYLLADPPLWAVAADIGAQPAEGPTAPGPSR